MKREGTVSDHADDEGEDDDEAPACGLKSPGEMTEQEAIAHLKFGDLWYALGVMDETTLRGTVENFRKSDDRNDEHWRYGAFMWFMEQHPTLTADQYEGPFWLGATDPDDTMGTSILLQILDRPDCPDRVHELAAINKKTKRYVGGHAAGYGRLLGMRRRRVADGRCVECGRRPEGSSDACPWCGEAVRRPPPRPGPRVSA